MALSAENLKNNLSNPLNTFLWEVKIPNFPGGIGDTETLLLRCQSTKMPGREVGVIEIPYKQGPKLQFPGKLNYSHDWECTFLEGEDGSVLNAMYAWAQTIVNDVTNVGGSESEIKTDIYLSLLNRKAGDEIRQIKLVGCFVKSIGEVSLDMNSEDVVKLPITFRYDHWEVSV